MSWDRRAIFGIAGGGSRAADCPGPIHVSLHLPAAHRNGPHRGARSRTRRQTGERSNEAGNHRFQLQAAVIHGMWGLALGALVLHPLAMAICGWFRLCGQTNSPAGFIGMMTAAFNPGAIHGAFAFAVFGLSIGMIEGYCTAVIRSQRDDLAQQLEINRAYRRELEARNTALRELEQIKRRMTRFLVHDLKNHVGCVLGYTKLLLKRAHANGWEQRDQNALMTVNRQAVRMEGAVGDVLKLAKLEHQPQLELRTLPAGVVLREALTTSAVGPGEGVVLVDDTVPPELVVDCDPTLIVRVMANLVVNAVKHNGGDVEVTLGAHDGPESVVLTCTDTGQGIPNEIRGRLFDEFTSSTREGKTTASYGLGLSFCKAAVEAHGGRIWFDSKNCVGSRFFVALPKRQSDKLSGMDGTTAGRMKNGRSATKGK